MTTPYHPFDLTLARDCKWPVKVGELSARIVAYNACCPNSHDRYPLVVIYGHTCDILAYANEIGKLFNSSLQLELSSDLTDPLVRAAVQVAHEKLGKQAAYRNRAIGGSFLPYDFPYWKWETCDYCLTEHLPAPVDPIAPGWNSDKLTVSQVGEGWRLLDGDEIGVNHNKFARRHHIQAWVDTDWEKNNWGGHKQVTYRTQLSREALAALDKPAWSLPAPPAGKQWHRNDFTEADLPPVTDGGLPWRPLLLGEPNEEGDEHSWNHITWNKHDNSRGAKATNTMNWYRTRRPVPPSPTFVPWDFESAPISLKVKQKNNGCKAVVYLNYDHYNWSGSPISFDGLFADFTHLDGSPCGMEVK